jgi:hypothetical protein
MRTPLNYMNYYYYFDAQKRSKLFQTIWGGVKIRVSENIIKEYL